MMKKTMSRPEGIRTRKMDPGYLAESYDAETRKFVDEQRARAKRLFESVEEAPASEAAPPLPKP